MKKKIDTNVTDLSKYLPIKVIQNSLKYIKINTIQEKSKRIKILTKIKQNELFENISEITGIAIPSYYEFKIKGKMVINKDYNINDKNFISKINYKDLTSEKLLEIANYYNSNKTGYNFKVNQIKEYNWLSQKKLNKCIKRLGKYISKNAIFEKEINKELNNRKLIGYIDCIDNDKIWEFKCVKKLQDEHILQLAIYMYLHKNDKIFQIDEIKQKIYKITLKKLNIYKLNEFKKLIKLSNELNSLTKINYKYYLFNILDNNILQISSSYDNLVKMVDYLIKKKYEQKQEISDIEFIKNNKKNIIKKVSGNNIMILDIETENLYSNYIVQIAYNIYDPQLNFIKKNNIIINDGSNIQDYFGRISLNELKKGIHPIDALYILNEDIKNCKYIVGHNIENFDMKIIIINMKKYNISLYTGYTLICTMKESKKYVNSKNKIGRLKNPKLSELYKKLFNEKLNENNLHNAIYDVEITFKCFEKMIKNKLISFKC